MKKILMVLMMVLGIGSAAFAGTYKNYEECCNHIWWETNITFHADLSAYKTYQWEVTDDLWGGFGRQMEKQMLNFLQVRPNFTGVVTQPVLVNGTDMTMWCLFYKNGKLQKTVVWTFYIPTETATK